MDDILDLAPKVELHLHLEGSIPLDALWDLVVAHGPPPDVPTPEALEARFSYRDFPHFIATWLWMTRFLDTTDAFELVGEAVAKSLVAQNIVYAEATFSPIDYARHGLAPQQIADAVRRGIDRVPEADVALLVDLLRDVGPETADRTLSQVLEVAAETGIVGVTIGGSEQDFPPEPFAAVFGRAADAGLRLTAHAGEAAGPGSVWGAIRSLDVERIGHGIRAVEDADLLSYLVQRRMPLEVCPSSNISTGAADGWDNHPVKALLEAGAVVTINSDDPTMFGCSLAGDFRELVDRLGPQLVDVEELTLAAAGAAFAAAEKVAELEHSVRSWWSKHG